MWSNIRLKRLWFHISFTNNDWEYNFMIIRVSLFTPVIMENKENCPPGLSLHQPDDIIWRIGGQSASLPCNIAYDTNRNIDFLWFVFKQDAHHSVDLMTQQHKYSLERNSLNINSLQANDSGVYHCAALFRDVVCSGAQEIGQGTTLVVRGKSIELNRTCVIWNYYSSFNVSLWVRVFGVARGTFQFYSSFAFTTIWSASSPVCFQRGACRWPGMFCCGCCLSC